MHITDTDTADPDVLRAQIRGLQEQVGRAQRAKDDLVAAISLLEHLRSESNDYDTHVASWCDSDSERDFLVRHELADASDWEVRVRYGGCIDMTLIVEAISETEAREEAENMVHRGDIQIDVTGCEDWDIYDDDVEILNVCAA
jgi:hypothetical protein